MTEPSGITAEDAAVIAKEFGLGLSEAAAIKQMAGTPDEARRLAKMHQPEHLRQLTREDVDRLTAEGKYAEILQANEDGRCRELYEAEEEPPPEGQMGRADLAKLGPEQVMEAKNAGKLDWLLQIEPPAGQLSRAQFDALSPDRQRSARDAGRTDWAEGNREGLQSFDPVR